MYTIPVTTDYLLSNSLSVWAQIIDHISIRLINFSLQIWRHCSASAIFQSSAVIWDFLPSTIKDSVCEHFMAKLAKQFSRKSIWLLSNIWENALVLELQVHVYQNHGTIQVIQKFRIQKCLLVNCRAPKTIPKSVGSCLCLKMVLLRQNLIMIYTDKQTDRVAVYLPFINVC